VTLGFDKSSLRRDDSAAHFTLARSMRAEGIA
jgi:hypothetical protein